MGLGGWKSDWSGSSSTDVAASYLNKLAFKSSVDEALDVVLLDGRDGYGS
jgi:hypothetical protein